MSCVSDMSFAIQTYLLGFAFSFIFHGKYILCGAPARDRVFVRLLGFERVSLRRIAGAGFKTVHVYSTVFGL